MKWAIVCIYYTLHSCATTRCLPTVAFQTAIHWAGVVHVQMYMLSCVSKAMQSRGLLADLQVHLESEDLQVHLKSEGMQVHMRFQGGKRKDGRWWRKRSKAEAKVELNGW